MEWKDKAVRAEQLDSPATPEAEGIKGLSILKILWLQLASSDLNTSAMNPWPENTTKEVAMEH